MKHLAKILLFGLVSCLMVGCGNDGPVVIPVTGTATFNGKPVPEGEIVFRPAEGVGHAHGGKIKDGKFAFDSTPGKKRVEITARREQGGSAQKAFAESGEGGPALQQYIPARYNDSSTLEAEVSEVDANEFSFQMK